MLKCVTLRLSLWGKSLGPSTKAPPLASPTTAHHRRRQSKQRQEFVILDESKTTYDNLGKTRQLSK
eukprot:12431504-Karenia_brevis.AAC.3